MIKFNVIITSRDVCLFLFLHSNGYLRRYQYLYEKTLLRFYECKQ